MWMRQLNPFMHERHTRQREELFIHTLNENNNNNNKSNDISIKISFWYIYHDKGHHKRKNGNYYIQDTVLIAITHTKWHGRERKMWSDRLKNFKCLISD